MSTPSLIQEICTGTIFKVLKEKACYLKERFCKAKNSSVLQIFIPYVFINFNVSVKDLCIRTYQFCNYFYHRAIFNIDMKNLILLYFSHL